MSRQREGGAVVPDKSIHEILAVGHALVPVDKPRRAKQFLRYFSKCKVLGERETCQTSGF